jgi:hypothetical protein
MIDMSKTTAGTRHPLAQAPLDELAAELGRRRAALPKLLVRREKLIEDLERIESQIIALQQLESQSSTIKPRSASFRSTSLASLTKGTRRGPSMTARIAKILGSTPMRPIDIAQELVKQGLHPGNKSLQVQVSSTLSKHDEFTRLARGQWIRS